MHDSGKGPVQRLGRRLRQAAFATVTLLIVLVSSLLFIALYPLPIGPECRLPDGAASAGLLQPVFPERDWEWLPSAEAAGFSRRELEAAARHVGRLPGTGLMVIVGGRVLMQCGDVQHSSYLASVRKSILAILYGKYVADGTIDLAKTLAEMGMDDHEGLLPLERRATIEHLISARSGVYHPASNPGDSLASAPPRGSQTPGTYYLYSNWDFNAAGAAFEAATGKGIFDSLARDLAAPIGMQDFHRDRQRKSGDLTRSRYPAYHMWLSTRDMARVGYLMLRKGQWGATTVIPAEWVDRMVSLSTPVEEMNPDALRKGPFGYGYMWWVYDGPAAQGAYRRAYSAQGAYGQYITVLPELDLVVAYKTDPDAQAHPGFWNWLRFELMPLVPTTGREDYQKLLDLLAGARCDGECG